MGLKIRNIFIMALGEKAKLILLILLIFLISFISYSAFLKNAWYVMDDYATLEMGGTGGSVIDASKKVINSLYSIQGRYQPIRLFLVIAFAHYFQEEYSAYYNFGLHLINLVLLFLLLRRFNINYVFIVITVLFFSLFGRYRMMEGPNVMIGGSGLNLFFILLTLFFLIKAIEIANPFKKTAFWGASYLSYLCIVFSYEVAFPLFLAVIYCFFIFYFKNKTRADFFKLKGYLYLLPYLIILLAYLIFFKMPAQGSYDGATIVWNFGNILTRLMNYIRYTIYFPIKFKIGTTRAVIVLLFYFIAVILALKMEKPDANRRQEDLTVLAFGIIFYLSSMVLFILNDWQSGSTDVMGHHTYLITAGSSILMVSIFSNLQWIFLDKSRKVYLRILIIIFFPFVLLSGMHKNIELYKGEWAQRTNAIKLMKYKMQNYIKDVNEIDGIIVKNFYHPYYNISGMNGAFLQWFDFKKNIQSGSDIAAVNKNKIRFKGPLSYYVKDEQKQEFEVENKRAEVFYLNDEDKTLLSFNDYINFEEGINIHQTSEINNKVSQNCYMLDALLKNINREGLLSIGLRSGYQSKKFFNDVVLIELNGEPIKKVLVTEGAFFIDISSLRGDINYFFVKIVSTDNRFKSRIKFIRFQKALDSVKYHESKLRDSLRDTDKELVNNNPKLLIWEWKEGFYNLEGGRFKDNWRWSSPEGALHVNNISQKALTVTLGMQLATGEKELSNLKIRSALFNDDLNINMDLMPYLKTITIPHGKHIIKFYSDAKRPSYQGVSDRRSLAFGIANFKVANCL